MCNQKVPEYVYSGTFWYVIYFLQVSLSETMCLKFKNT